MKVIPGKLGLRFLPAHTPCGFCAWSNSGKKLTPHALFTPRPHPTTISSAIARRLLISLAIGAVVAFFVSMLIIQHDQGALFASFGFWPLLLMLTSSHPREDLKHPNWRIALPLLLGHLLIVVGFVWYPPLALNLLGPLLTLLTVVTIAQQAKPASKWRRPVALGCGLSAGVGAALACWLLLGNGMDTLSITVVLVLAAGLTGLVGSILGALYPILTLDLSYRSQ